MKEEWIKFSELCERWKMNEYTVAKLVIDGELQSYTQDFMKIWIQDKGYLVDSPNDDVPEMSNKRLTVAEVKELIFHISDVEEFENKHGIGPHGTKESPDSRKPTDAQKDKEKAIVITKKYIADCEREGVTPRIYKAVERIKGNLSRIYDDKKTIHNWIKKEFPKESRKEGQGRPKKE